MKKKFFSLLAISILSFLLTLANINYLSAFAITGIDEGFSVLSKTWMVLHADNAEKYWLIAYVVSTIISCGASTIIILRLRTILSNKEQSHSLVSKTVFFVWLLLLALNVLLSLYYLLFIFLGVLIMALILLAVYGIASNQGHGGRSVPVRGYKRRGGSYVRSYYRSPPHH